MCPCYCMTHKTDTVKTLFLNTLAEVTTQLTSPRCALMMVLKAFIIPFTLFRRLLSARASKTKVKFQKKILRFRYENYYITHCQFRIWKLLYYPLPYVTSTFSSLAYNLFYSPNKFTVTLLAFPFFKIVAIPAKK